MKATTTDAEDLTYVRALVYGDSGVGKTTSLGTLPVEGVTIAVCERSVLPLREKSYKVLHLETWADAYALPLAFKNPDGVEDKAIQDIVKGTRLLVIDSLTAVGELCWKLILKVERPQLQADREKSQNKEKPLLVYEDLATMEDWGVYGRKMMNLITAINHLPVTVIMTALEGARKNKQGVETDRVPDIGGQTSLKCGALFDEVFNMISRTDAEGKNERVWQTFTEGLVRAKDSSGVLDPYEKPDWVAVLKKIKGDKGSKT